MLLAPACLVCAIWLWLQLAHGRFWSSNQVLSHDRTPNPHLSGAPALCGSVVSFYRGHGGQWKDHTYPNHLRKPTKSG